jgi:hypothetical protein
VFRAACLCHTSLTFLNQLLALEWGCGDYFPAVDGYMPDRESPLQAPRRLTASNGNLRQAYCPLLAVRATVAPDTSMPHRKVGGWPMAEVHFAVSVTVLRVVLVGNRPSTFLVEALDKIYDRNSKGIAQENEIQERQSPLAGFVLADKTLLSANPAAKITLSEAFFLSQHTEHA